MHTYGSLEIEVPEQVNTPPKRDCTTAVSARVVENLSIIGWNISANA